MANGADKVDDNAEGTEPEKNDDVESDKPSSEAVANKPLILNRPILGRKTTVHLLMEDNIPAEPILSQPGHPIIVPPESKDIPDSDKTLDPSKKSDAQDETPGHVNDELHESAENSTPQGDDGKETQTTTADTPDKYKNNGLASSPGVFADKTAASLTPETQKALREISEHDERQSQDDINNRQYFVPINAIAHKRSIKVSLGLTLLLLLLSLVLIDLMLDSGVILLLQKIPHTHFLSSSIYL